MWNASGGSEGSITAAHSTEDVTTGERRINSPSHVMLTGSNPPFEGNQIRKGHLRVSSDVTGLASSREPHPVFNTIPLSKSVAVPPKSASTFPPPTPLVPPPDSSPSVGQPPTHSLISLPEDAEDGQPHPSNSYVDRMTDDTPKSGDHDFLSPSAPSNPSVSPMLPLVPNAFRTVSEFEGLRSSVASHFSEKSFEVPITWVPLNENGERENQPSSEVGPRRAPSSAFPRPIVPSAASVSTDFSDPNPPGGWVNTPKADVQDPLSDDQNSCYTDSNLLNGTLQRDPELLKEPTVNPVISSSPQIVQPDPQGNDHFLHTRKKSETVVVENVPHVPQEPPPSDSSASLATGEGTVKATTGSWVVVNHREPSTGQAMDSSQAPSPTVLGETEAQLQSNMRKPSTVPPLTVTTSIIDQTQITKESSTRRRKSVMGRLLGQSPRKGEGDNQSPVAAAEEKRNRLKSKKLLPGRSRK